MHAVYVLYLLYIYIHICLMKLCTCSLLFSFSFPFPFLLPFSRSFDFWKNAIHLCIQTSIHLSSTNSISSHKSRIHSSKAKQKQTRTTNTPISQALGGGGFSIQADKVVRSQPIRTTHTHSTRRSLARSLARS